MSFVGERGLEPPRVAPLGPKPSVYTISPLAQSVRYTITYF